MKKGRKLGETSLRILFRVIDAGALGIAEIIQTLIETHNYDEFVRKRLYKQVYNLEHYGYLTKKNKNNKSFFHLTPKGKLYILKHLHLEKLFKKKWDGNWRIIIFDIPEYLKERRDYVRNHLKNLGFFPLQESVFITPYPVTGELDQLLREWGIRKYFRYLTVTEIDSEDEIKREFNIQ